MNYIAWFKELNKESIAVAGGKGANLGEMLNAGFPVPQGFAVVADAYWEFLVETRLKEEIEEVLKHLDVDDNNSLQDTSNQIQKLILNAKMSERIGSEIKEAYKMLCAGGPSKYKLLPSKALDIIKLSRDSIFVAVRSSATAEDLPEASFAGQQATYLNIKGADEVVKAVQACWASLFTARAIFYREKNNFPHMKVKISAIVQKMVDADKAGVAFSADPNTGAPDIIIEAGWGLGEMIVAGEVSPDNYVVDKSTMEIKSKKVNKQEWMKTKDPMTGSTKKLKVPDDKREHQVLTDKQMVNLAAIVKRIEEHYGSPQDIEWAVEDDKMFIVQSRAVTTIKKDKAVKKVDGPTPTTKEKKVILEGLGASPGFGAGEVVIIHSAKELDKVHKGDILVTEMTDPDMVPAMRRAAAIVTDKGGMTCHAAIVSREMGTPCVVGTEEATKKLKDGMNITVDGTNSVVYEGIVGMEEKKEEAAAAGYQVPITATKVYLNLGIPEKIDDYKNLPIDGVGLMRVEFIVADKIKIHPNELIKRGQSQKYSDGLAEGVARIARAIAPKPVVVRFSDFKTNEYAGLEGGEEFEPEEGNPMIGWRGCSRYISKDFEGAFRLECKAIKKVRDEMNLKNVWVMIPFVRNIWEVERAMDVMRAEGLERNRDFQVWLMAEVPSMVFLADKFAKMCDGFSIGSNDLTQLVLGVDRDSAKLGRMGYFDERNEAVKRAIKGLIEGAHKNGITISICGQAPSVYPEFTEFLVRNGIDSVSVSPDVVLKTRQIIAATEQKLVLRQARASLREEPVEEGPQPEQRAVIPTQPTTPPPQYTPAPVTRPLMGATAPSQPELPEIAGSEDAVLEVEQPEIAEMRKDIEEIKSELDEIESEMILKPEEDIEIIEEGLPLEPEPIEPEFEKVESEPIEPEFKVDRTLMPEVKKKTSIMKPSDFEYFDFSKFKKRND